MVVEDWTEVTEALLEDRKDYYMNLLRDFKSTYGEIFHDLSRIEQLLLLT